jgi:hypothetical protein
VTSKQIAQHNQISAYDWRVLRESGVIADDQGNLHTTKSVLISHAGLKRIPFIRVYADIIIHNNPDLEEIDGVYGAAGVRISGNPNLHTIGRIESEASVTILDNPQLRRLSGESEFRNGLKIASAPLESFSPAVLTGSVHLSQLPNVTRLEQGNGWKVSSISLNQMPEITTVVLTGLSGSAAFSSCPNLSDLVIDGDIDEISLIEVGLTSLPEYTRHTLTQPFRETAVYVSRCPRLESIDGHAMEQLSIDSCSRLHTLQNTWVDQNLSLSDVPALDPLDKSLTVRGDIHISGITGFSSLTPIEHAELSEAVIDQAHAISEIDLGVEYAQIICKPDVPYQIGDRKMIIPTGIIYWEALSALDRLGGRTKHVSKEVFGVQTMPIEALALYPDREAIHSMIEHNNPHEVLEFCKGVVSSGHDLPQWLAEHPENFSAIRAMARHTDWLFAARAVMLDGADVINGITYLSDSKEHKRLLRDLILDAYGENQPTLVHDSLMNVIGQMEAHKQEALSAHEKNLPAPDGVGGKIGEYTVSFFESTDQMKAVSQIQGHCVGTFNYDQKIRDGESYICLIHQGNIRDGITVEFSGADATMRQAQGKGRRPPKDAEKNVITEVSTRAG